MKKFDTFSGVAAPMAGHNIDTDRIIPARFLKTIKRSGLGVNLFNDVRYNDDGSEVEDFVLNQSQYRNSEILVTGDNFGCGSSREHAPWAILDFGIKVVISTSFADIFHNNCFKNGILPIEVTPEQLELLFDDADRGSNATLTVDLENQKITRPDGDVVNFEMDPFRKQCLLEGLDDIGQTLQRKGKIDGFEERQKAGQPWLYGEAAE